MCHTLSLPLFSRALSVLIQVRAEAQRDSSGMQSHCLAFNNEEHREGPQMVPCITATPWSAWFGKDRLRNALRTAEAVKSECLRIQETEHAQEFG